MLFGASPFNFYFTRLEEAEVLVLDPLKREFFLSIIALLPLILLCFFEFEYGTVKEDGMKLCYVKWFLDIRREKKA